MLRARHAPRRQEPPAAARVRVLLPAAPAEQPWQLPPLEEPPLLDDLGGEVPQDEPVQDEAPDQTVLGPDERSWSPGRAPQQPEPGLLQRLRAGRLDPGRGGVVALGVVAVAACLVAGLVLVRGRPQELPAPVVERPGTPVAGAQVTAAPAVPGSPVGEVVVAVAGRVRRPGLVRLPPGSRVQDALTAAGGLQPGADPGLLNLARKVVDGEQVVVGLPSGPTGAAVSGAGAPVGAAGGLVDLNAASSGELDALPGIGPVLAQRIVDWRTAHGPFRSVDQLREVPGIGEAKYGSLKDAVRV